MNVVHVYPNPDAVGHELTDDCVCGPTPELVRTERGDGWIYVHHKLGSSARGAAVSDATSGALPSSAGVVLAGTEHATGGTR